MKFKLKNLNADLFNIRARHAAPLRIGIVLVAILYD